MIKQLFNLIYQIFRVAFQGKFLIYFVFWAAVLFAVNKSGIYYAVAFTFFSIPFVLRKSYWDKTALWILLYSITLALFGLPQNSIPGAGTDHLFILLSPVPFYLFGKYIISKTKGFEDLFLFITITIVCYGFLLYKAVIVSVIDVGIINPLFSVSELSARPATHYGTIASLGLAGIVVFLTSSFKDKNLKDWILLCCFILSVLSQIHIVRRTGLIVLIFLILLSLFYALRERTSRMLLWVLCALFILGVILYKMTSSFELIEVAEHYSDRNEEDLQGLGGRWVRWIESFGALFSHPLGWYGNSNYYAQVHNYWLDNARIAGVLPFLFSVLATVQPLRKCIKVYKVQGNSRAVFFVGLVLILMLSNFVEPQLDSVPFHVSLMYMFFGILNSEYFDNYLYL